ncbi:MAG: hypothetical protein M3P14_00960 [Chloroflexota bacterium]|nr:hypothetical protein [Chloroflexota bacterium]
MKTPVQAADLVRQKVSFARMRHLVLWIVGSTALLIALGVLDQALTVAKV